jgi:hypothetical protein
LQRLHVLACFFNSIVPKDPAKHFPAKSKDSFHITPHK